MRIHSGQSPSLDTGGMNRQPLVEVFQQNQRDEVRLLGDVAGALAAEPGAARTAATMGGY